MRGFAVNDSGYLDSGYDAISEIRAFYHTSPHRFAVGNLITSQRPSKRNFACSNARVYLTDAPTPHNCLDVTAREDGLLVYLVEPLGRVRVGEFESLTT